jgi:hypothetical protein
MVKKVKNNKFSLAKPGEKKLTKLAASEYIRIQRMEARGEMLTEFVLVLAWVLRVKYNFGKKRIEDMISEVFELMSDTKMAEYGQELLNVNDINPQLIEEVGLDVKKLINQLATKHFNRVEEVRK